MIDAASGIEAYIRGLESKTAYRESEVLRDPSTNSQAEKNECRIYSSTDAKYCICVKIPQDFDFEGAPALSIKYDIDDGAAVVQHTIKNNQPWESIQFNAATKFEGRDGDYVKFYRFSFGEVVVADNPNLSDDQEAVEVARRGKIVVTVSRGVDGAQHTLESLRAIRPLSVLPLQSSENVVITHGKSHSHKAVEFEPTDACPTYHPFARSSEGEQIVFTFFYQSSATVHDALNIPTSEATTNDNMQPSTPKRKRKAATAPVTPDRSPPSSQSFRGAEMATSATAKRRRVLLLELEEINAQHELDKIRVKKQIAELGEGGD